MALHQKFTKPNHVFIRGDGGNVLIEAIRAGGETWGTFDYWLRRQRCVMVGERGSRDYVGPMSGKALFAKRQTSLIPHYNDDGFDWFDFGDRDDA